MMVLIITMIGFASFVSPFVRTDSAVLGRTQWSPLQIVIELHKGTLPVCSSDAFSACDDPRSRFVDECLDAVLGCGAAYALLCAIAAAALLFPRANFIVLVAALGIIPVCGEAKSRYADLQGLIYGAPFPFAGRYVHAGVLCLILAGVFGLLIWIAVTQALDF
jgi:hypothetical protein